MPRKILGLLVLVLIVFGSACFHDFVSYDDAINVTENPNLNPTSWEGLIRIWTAPYHHFYIPITYTVWAAIASVADQNPFLFHASVVLFHALNACWVVILLSTLLGSFEAALAGAALFALHPLQTESVAWVTALRDQLGAFFSLAALLSFLKERKKSSCALFAIALLCKPSFVVLPLVAGLLVIVFRERVTLKEIRTLSIWLLIALPAAIGTKLLQPDALARAHLTAYQRIWVAADTIGFYAKHLLWPFGLAPDYGRTPSVALIRWDGVFLAITGILAAAAIRSRTLALAIGISTAVLLPVLGLIPFEFQQVSTVADRYVYLAMLGPSLVFARLWKNWRPMRGALACILVACSALSIRQVSFWKNDETLFNRVLSINPASASAYNNLGDLHYRSGNYAIAKELFSEGLRWDPANEYLAFGKLRSCLKTGELDEAIRVRKTLPEKDQRMLRESDIRIARALLSEKRPLDAASFYRAELARAPKNLPLWNELAIGLVDSGHADLGIEAFDEALSQTAPASHEYHQLVANRKIAEEERKRNKGPTLKVQRRTSQNGRG